VGLDSLHVGEKDGADGFGVGDDGSGLEDDVLDDSFEGMPDREYGEECFARLDAEKGGEIVRLVKKVAVAQHDALGFARGARRVDDGGEILAPALFHFFKVEARILPLECAALFRDLGKAEKGDSLGSRRLGQLLAGGFEEDDGGQLGEGRAEFDHPGEEFLVFKDGYRAAAP